jgi:LysR family hca operon transcriptional activator
MELRHLRYFVAVAEEGGITNAAERRLHTAQPSLSRQIRDLELEVGVPLLERSARGIALTPAGRIFLDHARLALLQVEAAGEAARRAAQPEKAAFVVGFLAGQELVWLPETLRILREEEPDLEITLASQSSPELAGALMRGKVDVAFLRREAQAPGLAFKFLVKEPLVVVLPSGHRLAARKEITLRDLAEETYISPTRVAPALKVAIEDYAAKSGITLKPQYDAENLSSVL